MQEEIKNNLQVEQTSNQPFPEEARKEEFLIPQKNNNLLIYVIFIILLFGILGFLGWKYVFGEKITNKFFPTPTPTIQVVATPTVVVDPTSNWKTYKNEKWGFEFKYPNDFQLGNGNFEDRISVQNGNYKEIPISGACGGFLFGVVFQGDDLRNRNTRDKPYDFYLDGIKTKRIDAEDNLEGFKCTSSDIFVPDDANLSNYRYHIMLTKTSEIYPDLFDQILSTFKFVEKSTDISVTPIAAESGNK